MRFLHLVACLLVACSTPRPHAPYVHLVVPNGGPQLPAYLEAASAWEALGFTFGFADSGRTECDVAWWSERVPACQLTIGVIRDPQLRAVYGTNAMAFLIDAALTGYTLLIAVAHELGHVLLYTPEHTKTGIMSGGSVALDAADRALACRTIRRCL